MTRQHLLSKLVQYPQICKDAVVTAPSNEQLEIYEARAFCGADSIAGLAIKFANGSWSSGELDASATPDYVSDNSATIKAGTATQIIADVNTDGFLIQASKPFNVIGMNISTADGGVAAYTYTYYNGSAYATLPTYLAGGFASTGISMLSFGLPADWAAGTTAAVGGDEDLYSVRVVTDGAGSAAVAIDDLWVGQLLTRQQLLNAGGADYSLIYPMGNASNEPLLLESGESLMGYFETANAANGVSVLYKSMK